MTHAGGRPATYKTNQELQKELDRFFVEIPEERLTVTGLAIFLGFTTRQALLNYECKPEFVDSIKKAKLKIENAYELSLRKNGRSGDIFALKNFDWKDKQEIDNNTKVTMVGDVLNSIGVVRPDLTNDGTRST